MVLRVLQWLVRTLRGRDDGSTGTVAAGGSDAVEDVAAPHDDDLPSTCLRGLRKQDWITPEGVVASHAFVPDRRPPGEKPREDGGKEVSINWEDDDSVLSVTFKLHGQHGAARLSRSVVAGVSQKVPGATAIRCERRLAEDQPNNRHHGNLVFRADLSGPLEKMLAAALALNSALVRRD